MMRFDLKVVDGSNRAVALELDASDEAAARDLARTRGYTVLAVDRRSGFFFHPPNRKQAFPTTLFAIELLALLDAGLNVVEALQALAEKEPSGENHRLLTELLGALYRGESLSQAVARFPAAFSALFVATVRSSERTGNLKESLARHIGYQEELDRVRRKVVAALLYPAILIVVGSLVLSFLMLYVVPRFARVYDDIATELPFFSKVLLSIGHWVEGNGTAALLFLGLALAGCVYAFSRNEVRARVVQRLWCVPAIGERMMIYELARFYRTVGMLLLAGVPAVRAFEMVVDLLSPSLRGQLARAATLLAEGRSIADALTSVGLATPVATRMMAVGERSGRMGELMDRIARFYDDQTARFVDTFTRVFEPILMTFLGLAVGMVVILMYMPIFELAGAIH